MRRYHLIFLLLLFITLKTTSQVNFVFNQQKADSLLVSLPSLSGCERIQAMNELAYLFVRRNPDLCDSLLTETLSLIDKYECQNAKATTSYTKGILSYVQGNYTNSYSALYHALDLSQENQDTAFMIDTYYHLASLSYFSRTDIQQGINYMKKALELAINSEDNLRIAQAYAAMGFVSFHSGNGTRGIEMFEKYFSYSEGLPVSQMERALMLASYGDCFELLGDYRKGIDIYLEALAMFDPESVEERALLSQCSAYLGERYLMLGKPDSALFYYQEGMAYARKYSHLFGSMINAIELAEYYYKHSSFELCKAYCDSILYFGKRIERKGSFFDKNRYEHLLSASMEIFVPLTPDYKKHIARTDMLKALQMLQEIYKKEGNSDAAYTSLQSSFRLQDSIIRYERKKELMEILTKYETDQKEKKILILSQENQLQEMKIRQNSLIIIGMALLVLLIVIMAIILFKQNKIKNENQAILLKQRLFRSQMNPHFIFNAMGNIQSSIINEEPDKAIKYLSKFSKLMRNILEGSLEEKILLAEEISLITNYLDIQKMRFNTKFEYSIVIDEKIDTEAALIPPMLLQPFIENAIEHGINHKESKGNVKVIVKKDRGIMVFEIEDDGVGRTRAKELSQNKNKGHRSYATILTQERIEALNKKQKKKITFAIIDLTDKDGMASGTKVVFEIPIK